jgi:hypothetical protein
MLFQHFAISIHLFAEPLLNKILSSRYLGLWEEFHASPEILG